MRTDPTNTTITQAQGALAHDAVDSGNPLKIGGKATTNNSIPAAVSATGDRVDGWFDMNGAQIVRMGEKATFAAAGSFTPAATPSDLLTIFGSATKTIKVLSIKFGATNTAAGSQEYFISKRSAVTTGGTPVAATVVPLDSNDTGTATVNHYTADPTPGTAVGNIAIHRVASPVAKPATFAGIVEQVAFEMLPVDSTTGNAKPVVLRGTGEGVVVNFNDVALVAGQTHIYSVLWTEE